MDFFGGVEEEVLFSMYMLFRIGSIKSIDKRCRMQEVELTIIKIVGHWWIALENELQDQLDKRLFKVDQPEKVEYVYAIFLKQTTKESKKVNNCHWHVFVEYHQK